MKLKLIINHLFVYSESTQKYFYAELSNGLNIISGRNTSGKSTFFLAINYAFGINDFNSQLRAILDYKPIFRLDCVLQKGTEDTTLTLIREDEMLLIKIGNLPIRRFNGISANNSAEHVKLKEYFHDLFNFHLSLESQNEYKLSPIEVIFLPYFISQKVGWVYMRKSFSSLDFFRNFKNDYLDYYLGIENDFERSKKKEIELKLKAVSEEIRFLERAEVSNDDFQISKLSDEDYSAHSISYIESYSEKLKELTADENDYVLKCNELGFLIERLSVLRKVSRNHSHQDPETGLCPVCEQSLAHPLSASYKFLQEQNDTNTEITSYKSQIKNVQSKINTLNKRIRENKVVVENNYRVVSKYTNSEHSFESWLNNKTNIRLSQNVHQKIGELVIKQNAYQDELKKYKTAAEVEKLRIEKNIEFAGIFSKYRTALETVDDLDEPRFNQLYDITAFPSDGVELHKTVMAYHFAFNKLIKLTNNIHRLPFMLDAIFKEDIETYTRGLILKFISNYMPDDTQTIISIAEKSDHEKLVQDYNANYFGGKGKIIFIGDGINVKSFLTDYNGQQPGLLKETLEYIENN
ncbi:hypothetical protein [Pedobacter cryoconitis]|uniref:hypothetical protein n=1 Tax=Pedobacter cryoconitis TaxID=188932 RepID=UPI00161BDA46|nr:hypothetical protein [Pedobacter cryoconitis]MBB5645737.1 hypothetical protein [Pedobacter cryoconitis]